MGDLRPLETFALDREILRSLIAKGFKYAGEVVHMSSESLSSGKNEHYLPFISLMHWDRISKDRILCLQRHR